MLRAGFLLRDLLYLSFRRLWLERGVSDFLFDFLSQDLTCRFELHSP